MASELNKFQTKLVDGTKNEMLGRSYTLQQSANYKYYGFVAEQFSFEGFRAKLPHEAFDGKNYHIESFMGCFTRKAEPYH